MNLTWSDAWQSSGCFEAFSSSLRGLEKESLRVSESSGRLAQTPHPAGLGSALKHPYITTDYSEALMEFITPAFSSYRAPIEFLTELHQAAYQHIAGAGPNGQGELLWSTSMPCILPQQDQIPIAYYGVSNLGQLKRLYRQGLSYRYGAQMQTISGVHYNFSFSEAFWQCLYGLEHLTTSQKWSALDPEAGQAYKNDKYFHLIRNFKRFYWWLVLLMGASPAVCRSFLAGQSSGYLRDWRKNTGYLPFGTSLRMSDLGYQNPKQGPLYICHNDLQGYVSSLERAIHTPHADYQRLSAAHPGEHIQLSPNILQIENEYYGPIRPKRTPESLEHPTHALKARGVEYIEIRCLDLNPLEPVGVSEVQMRCLDVFLLYCLMEMSPHLSQADELNYRKQLSTVVLQGRSPNQPMLENARKMAEELKRLAEYLGNQYVDAVNHYLNALEQPEMILSASLLQKMFDEKYSFFEMSMALSRQHRDAIVALPVSLELSQRFADWAETSRQAQAALESADSQSFDDYLQAYLEARG